MKDSEAWEYIESKPGWIALSTNGHDGFPHTVPIGYFASDGEIFIGCIDRTQKVKNVERNKKISLMLESGETMANLKGVLIKADAEIIRDDVERLAISRLAALQRGVDEADLPQTVRPGSVYIRAKPIKIVSWNYGKP
tara:strand:+ start:619 stop:1032 length:414 start_codon:yes stop_codon:yes gene_type:complete